MCESDSPFRGRNPSWRGLVMTASSEFANPFVSKKRSAYSAKGEGAFSRLTKRGLDRRAKRRDC